FFSSRRRHTRFSRDWSSDVCSSDLGMRLTNHLTVVPAVEAAKYSAMTGAYPRTTGNTYKYFDGANVVGQGSTVNLAQTITQAMQGERTALAINEAAVKSEEGDGFAYI